MSFIALDYWDVALAASLLIVNGGLSIAFRLGLERRLAIAAVRMVVQLTLVGLVLKALFAASSPWLTTLAALVMVGFAGREAMARQDRSFTGFWSYGIGTSAMCVAATGLVSLPGMMTGQILAGVDPVEAVKYQLLVMFLIGGGTALGVFAAVMAGARRLTDARHRLRLDRLIAAEDRK